MKTFVLAISLIAFASVSYADTLVQHTQNMATNNAMYHDSGYAENVFMHNGHLGPIRARIAARVAWAHSPAHRQNNRRILPFFGMAVSHSNNATYVTGRAGLFPRR